MSNSYRDPRFPLPRSSPILIPMSITRLTTFRAYEADNLAGPTHKPSKYLPFPLNRSFVGRTNEIDTLERRLFIERDCQKIAIVGLGGVGKTQVALRFSYLVLEKHLDVSVFWVPALGVELSLIHI